MDSINFTANRIKSVKIPKKFYTRYIPSSVSLVEMDVLNKNDIDAIYQTTQKWDSSFTVFTYDDMRKVSDKKQLIPYLHVYALTTQRSGFDKLKTKNILGVAEVVENYNDGNKVEVLQTKPLYIKSSENKKPKFKHIGKALISYVKEKFSDKPLYLNPARSAVQFYEKQGFKNMPEKNNVFWIPPKS